MNDPGTLPRGRGRKRQEVRRCPRCTKEFPRAELGTVGYCGPCRKSYYRDRKANATARAEAARRAGEVVAPAPAPKPAPAPAPVPQPVPIPTPDPTPQPAPVPAARIPMPSYEAAHGPRLEEHAPPPFDPHAPGGYTREANRTEQLHLAHGADVMRQCTRVYHALDVLTRLWALADKGET